MARWSPQWELKVQPTTHLPAHSLTRGPVSCGYHRIGGKKGAAHHEASTRADTCKQADEAPGPEWVICSPTWEFPVPQALPYLGSSCPSM